MRYELDDMYDMLNEYKKQDTGQAIQRQETVNHEKNEVPESRLTAQAVSANGVDQQDDFSIEERFFPQNDCEAVIPVSEKPDCTESPSRYAC